MIHGHIMHASPSAELAPGVSDLTWTLYDTQPQGIVSVESQVSEDWTYERINFVWGEDLQDYCGLHGLVVFLRTNMDRKCGSVRLGKNILNADFILCGQLLGEPTPFHTEGMAYEIIQWFTNKQEQWHAIYSQPTEREEAEDAEAEKANPGSRPKKRLARPRLH